MWFELAWRFCSQTNAFIPIARTTLVPVRCLAVMAQVPQVVQITKSDVFTQKSLVQPRVEG